MLVNLIKAYYNKIPKDTDPEDDMDVIIVDEPNVPKHDITWDNEYYREHPYQVLTPLTYHSFKCKKIKNSSLTLNTLL